MNINIYKITLLLSKQKVNSLGLFNDNKSSEKSKYINLFNKIHSNDIQNDNDAIKELGYKTKASFTKFKDRYKSKLLKYFVLTDAKVMHNDSSNLLFSELVKLYSVGKALIFRGYSKDAVEIFKYINKQSVKNDYLDLLLFSTMELKRHFAYVTPNKKLYAHYSKILKKCRHDVNRLQDVTHYYDEISHNNVMLDPSKISSFKKETISTCKKLMLSIQEKDTFEYKFRVYEIAAYAYNLNENYKESIRISKESVKLCFSHFQKIHSKTVFAYKDILSAYLRLNDIENAQLYLSEILKHIKSIAHNYFRYKTLEFTLYMSTLNYDKLYQLTQEIVSLKQLKDYNIHKEEWAIREAFVSILVEAGKVDPKLVESSKRKFRLNRFINEVEFYSKDKRGSNISVLVIQLIHFLLRKEYDKIIDKLDALNQYTFRYLRNDDTLRSNCFIKPVRTKRYVAKYEKKLAENPFQISMKEIAVEIIPYEQLWVIIMEILNINLEQKKRKR